MTLLNKAFQSSDIVIQNRFTPSSDNLKYIPKINILIPIFKFKFQFQILKFKTPIKKVMESEQEPNPYNTPRTITYKRPSSSLFSDNDEDDSLLNVIESVSKSKRFRTCSDSNLLIFPSFNSPKINNDIIKTLDKKVNNKKGLKLNRISYFINDLYLFNDFEDFKFDHKFGSVEQRILRRSFKGFKVRGKLKTLKENEDKMDFHLRALRYDSKV